MGSLNSKTSRNYKDRGSSSSGSIAGPESYIKFAKSINEENLKTLKNVQNDSNLYHAVGKYLEDCFSMPNALKVILDIAHKIQGSLSHDLGSNITSLSKENFKVLDKLYNGEDPIKKSVDILKKVRKQKNDILKKVCKQKKTMMRNKKKQENDVMKELETLEKWEVAARITMAIAAIVIITSTVALTLSFPPAAAPATAIAGLFLTFLQCIIPWCDGIFKDHKKKRLIKSMEKLTIDSSKSWLDEIQPFVQKLKAKFLSQKENADSAHMPQNGILEIMTKMENFARTLKEMLQVAKRFKAIGSPTKR